MGNEDTNQPGPSNSPPKDEGKKERSKDGFLDKAAAVVFQGLDDKARDQIRDLNNCQAITCNPAVLPARLSATEDNKSLGGILRSLLSTHEGPLKGITETELTQAIRGLDRDHKEQSDVVKVLAPTEYGTAELTPENQAAWRNWAKDSMHGMDLAAIFRYCARYHKDRQCCFSEETLRDNLFILCPREIMTSLNSKAEKDFPLQKIFDDFLLITDSIMSSEEIRLEVERVLANPVDPIAALRSVLSILEKNSSANNASLDAECLAEAKRMVRRLGGNQLYGSVESLFLHRRSQDFLNYFDILKTVYPQELACLARSSKPKIHHIPAPVEEEEEPKPTIEHISSAISSAIISKLNLPENKPDKGLPPTPSGPVTAPTPTAPPAPTDSVDSSSSLSHAILDTLNQQNSLLLHNLQNQPAQPGLGMRNRSKSDRSQRSRGNKTQDTPKTQNIDTSSVASTLCQTTPIKSAEDRKRGRAPCTDRTTTPVNAAGQVIISTYQTWPSTARRATRHKCFAAQQAA